MDGGARGNPGPAAVAAVASDSDGEVLAERSAYIARVRRLARAVAEQYVESLAGAPV